MKTGPDTLVVNYCPTCGSAHGHARCYRALANHYERVLDEIATCTGDDDPERPLVALARNALSRAVIQGVWTAALEGEES